MGKLQVILPDDLLQEFRIEIAKRLGGKKGDLTIAVEEAVRDWIAKEE